MANNKKAEQNIGSAFDLAGKSFEIVKKNWQAFALVYVLSFISAVVALFSNQATDDSNKTSLQNSFGGLSGYELGGLLGVGIAIAVLLAVISLFLFTMQTILEVETTAGKKPSVGHLFNKSQKYWLRLIAVMIITGVIIITGFIFLIIPGIIALGRLVMAPYILIDKDMGIIESIKASNELGRKHIWKVLAAVGVIFLVGIASAIFSFIPIFGSLVATLVTIAFSLVIPLRYRQLKKLQ